MGRTEVKELKAAWHGLKWAERRRLVRVGCSGRLITDADDLRLLVPLFRAAQTNRWQGRNLILYVLLWGVAVLG
jgi:hypothetical protein